VHGYQTWIINKNAQGVNGFGSYDKSGFSDLKATETDEPRNSQEPGQYKDV
jgi:hypothetical protein